MNIVIQNSNIGTVKSENISSSLFDLPRGTKEIRRCGSYWEYCDGCCNSCEKNKCCTSDRTTYSLDKSYISDFTVPEAQLWG